MPLIVHNPDGTVYSDTECDDRSSRGIAALFWKCVDRAVSRYGVLVSGTHFHAVPQAFVHADEHNTGAWVRYVNGEAYYFNHDDIEEHP